MSELNAKAILEALDADSEPRPMTGLGKAFLDNFKKRQEENPLVTVNVLGIDIEITKRKAEELEKFYEEHQLPLEKLGAIGGEWTLCITPTSLGPVYVVGHSNGDSINITPFEWW